MLNRQMDRQKHTTSDRLELNQAGISWKCCDLKQKTAAIQQLHRNYMKLYIEITKSNCTHENGTSSEFLTKNAALHSLKNAPRTHRRFPRTVAIRSVYHESHQGMWSDDRHPLWHYVSFRVLIRNRW